MTSIPEIKVLDHGYVRLVDHMGNDLSVVRAARVSYDAAWRAGNDTGNDTRLIHYLYRNKHTSPFEAVTFTFEVYAPIFVFRQWHRHRTWSYNELSGRYKELPPVFYIPDPSVVGVQSKNNKQARDIVEIDRSDSVYALEDYSKQSYRMYQWFLQQGWPRELARMVLPLNTYSHMFATVNLRNLFHFIGLRDQEHAQFEIREYSKAMKELIRPIVPISLEAFEANQ